MSVVHPCKDHTGKTVTIHKPSTPSPLGAWLDAATVVTVIPGGKVPTELNGLPFAAWTDAPTTTEGWNTLAGTLASAEPPFEPVPGKKVAAGVVVEEPDGRIWLVHPTNAYGGYHCTFPKGTVEHGLSLAASAIKEAWEEAGLRVEIIGWLADTDRTTSKARYYRARRIGGNPADMGWESQATSLIPRSRLGDYLTHPSDSPLLKVLTKGD